MDILRIKLGDNDDPFLVWTMCFDIDLDATYVMACAAMKDVADIVTHAAHLRLSR